MAEAGRSNQPTGVPEQDLINTAQALQSLKKKKVRVNLKKLVLPDYMVNDQRLISEHLIWKMLADDDPPNDINNDA